MNSVTMSENHSWKAPDERIVPCNDMNASFVSLGLPEDLRAAYKETKFHGDTMDTYPSIHSCARKLYETVF